MFLSCFLTSCLHVNFDISPSYWGESYGKMKNIDGLLVCLRTDGYYQVVGIRKAAINDGIIVIPQHINGHPVMGLGAPYECYSTSIFSKNPLYETIYTEKKSLMLESHSIGAKCYFGPNGAELFDTRKKDYGLKKVYVNSHHVNLEAFCCVIKGKPIYICNYADIETKILHFIKTYSKQDFLSSSIESYLHESKKFYTVALRVIKYISNYNSETYNEQRIMSFYSDGQDQTFVYSKHFKDFLEELYFLSIDSLIMFTIEESLGKLSEGLTMNEIEPDFEGESFESDEYRMYLMEKYTNEYKFNNIEDNIIVANTEFHYNLLINGEEYHNFQHPENDLYWIDYLEDGELLMEPPAPYVEGYKFMGWYKDKECTDPFDFSEPVSGVPGEQVWLQLYGKWE